jgi:SAM-dependent methyltransferase
MNVNCYVCNTIFFKPILKAIPSMSSDGQTVNIEILKEECQNCGTVRSSDISFLTDFYNNFYKLNIKNNDPQYVYNEESMFKSQMHFEWIEKLVGERIKDANSMIEIGCGSGNLLNLFDVKNKHGIEPSKEAAEHAFKIANVRNISYEDILDQEKYDLILSTCVIEHTIDPNDFLKKNWNIAKENSLIIIGVPIQDSESFDVYFLDHLHHFTTKQFIYLCQKNGFEVEKYEVGYKCITTIGYFVLRKRTSISDVLAYEKNINFYTSYNWISNLNIFLENNKEKNIIAFGYGETSFFYQTYTNLNSFVNYYIDDVKANTEENVISIEDAIQSNRLKNSILILLANPHYHAFLKKKFEGVYNLEFYSPFSNIITI